MKKSHFAVQKGILIRLKKMYQKNMYMRSIRSSGMLNRPPRKKKCNSGGGGEGVCPRGMVKGQIEPCIRP